MAGSMPLASITGVDAGLLKLQGELFDMDQLIRLN
jgi:hypothetical protein